MIFTLKTYDINGYKVYEMYDSGASWFEVIVNHSVRYFDSLEEVKAFLQVEM